MSIYEAQELIEREGEPLFCTYHSTFHDDCDALRIYLDDVRSAPRRWLLCRNPTEFKEAVLCAVSANSTLEAISFDNDLGAGELEGWELCKWVQSLIIDGDLRKPKLMLCHSMNPVARERIEGIIYDIYNRI